ncbi:hypothetical protein GCM10011609_50200 [Lentzea pudingi]|uniref:Uncharacterized protein n=1 Tax=Lentzea pudingi TaxID=1789439 RepID=A0ABQ2IDB0_9PSEU|nr:hypothetical protein [Lentzea pudingi]GGN04946.1 hypothetical protein GCM10011609_50200 [Lentzea pudingi]
MTTPTPYNGVPHPRRRCATSGTSTVLLAAASFVFTAWMLAHDHSPVVSVSTTAAVLAVTITLSRSRPFTARFGPLPPAGSMVVWEDDQR